MKSRMVVCIKADDCNKKCEHRFEHQWFRKGSFTCGKWTWCRIDCGKTRCVPFKQDTGKGDL